MKRLLCVILCLCLAAGFTLPVYASDSPGNLGWFTDDLGGQNFSGWAAESASDITGTYNETAGYHRIWKPYLANQATFTAELTIRGANDASGYVRMLGVTLELDGRHGTGQQVFVKLNGTALDWMPAEDCSVNVKVVRESGGDLQYTLTGKGSDAPVTLTAASPEGNENLEIGLYAGTVSFTGIHIVCGEGTATAPVFPVSPSDGPFLYNTSGTWSAENETWTAGKNAAEGNWVASQPNNFPSAQAVYAAKKLAGNWFANVQIEPISTNNSGRAVSKLQILDQYRNPKIIFTLEQIVATKQVLFSFQALNPEANDWINYWQSSVWEERPDTAYNVRLDLRGETLSLAVTGNRGYTHNESVTLPAGIADILCYAGVLSERTAAKYSNFQVESDHAAVDLPALARTAMENLCKNFSDGTILYPVVYGLLDGTVTNAGVTVQVPSAGAMWESTILLMALDTYARSSVATEDEQQMLSSIIANTVNRFTTAYTEEQCVTPATGPINYCMDDCGWNVVGFLLGWKYNKQLGKTEEAATCLDYAKKLFLNSYDIFYDDALGGGMWYQIDHHEKSLYACTLAFAGDELYRITGEDVYRSRCLDIYNGIENNLGRADGLYWMGIDANGILGRNNPYDISEGGSCTFLCGNMCMAVLNVRLGHPEKALRTAIGMTRYETDNTGAWLNDRDAWNNTFFLDYFVREVINAGYADSATIQTYQATVAQILKHCIFDDGYYSASWKGPQEPSSHGYPSGQDGIYYTGPRNRWGTQEYQDGRYVGSTPDQMMTSATTAHVLLAAPDLIVPQEANLTGLSVSGSVVWPAVNPDISTYSLIELRTEPAEVTLTWSDGASATLNGEPVTTVPVTVASPTMTIVISPADGSESKTYTVRLRADGCPHTETERRGEKAASCTEDGYTGDVYCSVCGELLETGKRIPAVGHTWSGGVCTKCGEVNNRFADVHQSDWFFTVAYQAFEQGLMNGTSDTTFVPTGDMTRAMLVQVLYNLEHRPDSSGAKNPFSDVSNDQWYADAVIWAASNEIVGGVGGGRFDPDGKITREQIATILFRYAGFKHADISGEAELGAFIDAKAVSAWALSSIKWAVDAGILSGRANGAVLELAPLDPATRAEVAAMMVRFLKVLPEE